MSERKILPCPFCGKNSFQLGKKPFERRIGHDTFYCGFATHDCGVLGYTITLYAENLEEEHEVRENLIRKWNTRKPMEKVVEQEYKELTAAVKESGIALKLQKELQRLIDKEFIRTEQSRKEFTMKCEREGR